MSGDSEVEVQFKATTQDFDSRVNELNASLKGFDSAAAATKAAAEEASTGMVSLGHGTAGVTRELIVLGHEAISGNFTRIPGSLMVLAERMGGLSLSTVGVAAGVAAVGYVLFELAANAEKTAEALNRVGIAMEAQGRSHFDKSGLEDYMTALSHLPGVNKEAARSIVGDLGTATNISQEALKKLIGVVTDYASVVGEKAPQAAADFVKMSEDPMAAANKLAQTYRGILTPAQFEQIQNFTRQGDKMSAMDVIADALTNRFAGLQAKGMTAAQEGANMLGNALSWVGKEMAEQLDIITPLEKAVGHLAQAYRSLTGAASANNSGAQQVNIQAQLNDNVVRGLQLQQQVGGELTRKAKLLADIKELSNDATSAEVQGDQKTAASLRGTAAELQAQLDNMRDANTQKEAMAIATKRSLYQQDYEDYREKEELKTESGKETADQEYTNLIAAKQKEAALVAESFRQEMALYSTASKAYQQMKDEELRAEAKFATEVDKLRREMQKADDQEQKRRVDGWMHSLSQVNSAFASSITGMIGGTRTWQQAFQSIAQSAFQSFIKNTLESGEKWVVTELLKTGATTAGATARTGVESAAAATGAAAQSAAAGTSIMKDAGQAAAGAYASVSAIPFVGWILAPLAAAAAFTAVMAFDSFDKGTDFVPKDMLANIHKGEMIIPAAQAEAVRGGGASAAPFTGGGISGIGGSNDTHMHFHVQALDGKDVGRFFNKHGRTIADTMRGHLRSGGSRATLSRT